MADPLWPDGRPDWADGYTAGRRLDGDEWVVVIPLTFGRGRVCVADRWSPSIEHW